MKILALDMGDKWVGSAISDPLKIISKPYKTIKIEELISFIENTLNKENIEIIVIGYPKTLKGQESEQTKKVILIKDNLEKQYPTIKWVLWDERLSSKRAQSILGRGHLKKEDKVKEHSIAAAFILQSYLDYLAIQN